MNGKKSFVAILFTALLLPGSILTASAKISKSEEPAAAHHKKEKKSTEKDDSKKKYETLINEAQERRRGLFNVIKNKDAYYFEIPASLLGRDMLVVNKLQKVPAELNESGVNRGIAYQHQMIRFEWDKQLNKLKIRQERPMPLSPAEDAITRSVKDNYISPLIHGFDIYAYNADSTAIVVKVNDIFNGEETSINDVFSNINLGTPAIGKLSKIETIKAYKNNVVAYSELTTKVTEGRESVFITVNVSSSILLLPEKPMMGRLDNQKVGYFTVDFLHYSDRQQRLQSSEYITRWRLEPKDEEAYLRGELVEPKQQIVFYIDPATPYQWRKYIKQGVEDWNIAFEKAGFKNAITAKVLPDSLKQYGDDVNYSVINYAASEKMNAMGPSLLDPRSGEILEADVMWWHNVLTMVQEWNTIQTGAIRSEVRTTHLPEEVMGDAIRFVACHEVGHSLGLRHNMIASNAYTVKDLRSKEFTDRMNSTASSIMDYARYNYVAQPGDGVTAVSPHIGPYDIFAIEYGYRWLGKKTPEAEKPELFKFLEAHSGKLYKYSEAQDPRDAVDPRAQIEDLGDNSVAASKMGIANLKRIIPNLIKWTTTGEKGQTYDELSRMYYAAIHQWNNYLYHALANIGGIYIENTTVGDGVKTFTFVEKERQREAMQFLIDEVFCYPEWLFNNEIGSYTYLLKKSPMGIIENSPSKMMKNAQAFLFWDLLSNNRIMRMLENESENGEKAFTAVDMMDMLHKALFRKTEQGRSLDVVERSIQKNFVDALITAAAEYEGVKVKKNLTGNNPFLMHQTPFCSCDELYYGIDSTRHASPRTLNFYGSQLNRISDAISVKRGELLRIKELLQKRMSSGDIATQYHYKDLILRINTGLGVK